MYTLLIILTILAALLLIGAVLIQRSKGGGLSSSFAGSNQIMGVRRTNSFIEKVTWTLAGLICLFSILSALLFTGATCYAFLLGASYEEAGLVTLVFLALHLAAHARSGGNRK